MRKFYYPDNLTAVKLYKYWTGLDLAIILALFVVSIFFILALGIWFFLLITGGYALVSARFFDNYSLTKLSILGIRFFFTDILVLKWRK